MTKNKYTLPSMGSTIYGIMILVVLGLFSAVYAHPVQRVSLEVGIALEYETNLFGLVIDAKGLDGQGEMFQNSARRSRLLNQTISAAVNQTINDLRKEQLIDTIKPEPILIAVAGENKQSAALTAAKLRYLVKEKGVKLGWQNLECKAFAASLEEWTLALENALTPGRFLLLKQLEAWNGTPNFSYSEYVALSIQELISREQALKNPLSPPPVVAVTVNPTPVPTKTTTTTTTTTSVAPAPATGLDAITTATPKK